MRAILTFVMVVVLQACGAEKMYRGASLSEGRVVTIKGTRDPDGVSIFFGGINSEGQEYRANEIEVAPGSKEIRVYFITAKGNSKVFATSLMLHGEAGRTYRVVGYARGNDVWIWIEDADTRDVVAGRPPWKGKPERGRAVVRPASTF